MLSCSQVGLIKTGACLHHSKILFLYLMPEGAQIPLNRLGEGQLEEVGRT